MNQNVSAWADLAKRLRDCRVASNLRLKDIKGSSESHLSRVERNLQAPNEKIVEAYENATHEPGLVEAFRRIARQGDATDAGADTNEFYDTHFELQELDTTIRLTHEGVYVRETRAIRSLLPSLSEVLIRQGLFERNGVTPTLLSLAAVGVGVPQVEWVSKNFFTMRLELPRMLGRNDSARFTLEYMFDTLYPRYTFQPLIQAQRLRLVVQFTDVVATPYEVRGLSSIVVDDACRALDLRQRPSRVPALSLDRFNTVLLEFDRMSTGLLYGIIW